MKSKQLTVPARLLCCLLAAVMAQPLFVQRVLGADIAPGYTFTSGEANVTHTKLNNAAAGTINTTFFSGKSSAGTDPSTSFTFLLHDTVTDTYKKSTLAAGIFDHGALLNSRTLKTAPSVGDVFFIADSGAYKGMTLSNAIFGGAATGPLSNDTRIPALIGGVPGGFSLSNLWANTNRITSLVDTNTVPQTNDSLAVLQDGQMKRLFLLQVREWVRGSFINSNVVQSVYTTITNIATTGSGNWSNVTTIGSSTLSNAITPRAASSKVLVRVVFNGSYVGIGSSGMLRVLRNGVAIGVGDSDGGNRVEAGAAIFAFSSDHIGSVVWEWLDSPASASAVGYNVQVTGDAAGTVFINSSSGDSNDDGHARVVSTLTLQEVLQ